MVQEILKNIDLKVDQELLRIKTEKEKAVLGLEKKYKDQLEKQKQANIRELEEKLRALAEEELVRKRSELEFAALKEKNKIIEQVFKEAEKRIVSLPGFKKLIASLLKGEIKGKIKAGKKTAAILKEQVTCEIEEGSEEGFLVIGEEINLDFRIQELLRQFKEKHGSEIIKKLFPC